MLSLHHQKGRKQTQNKTPEFSRARGRTGQNPGPETKRVGGGTQRGAGGGPFATVFFGEGGKNHPPAARKPRNGQGPGRNSQKRGGVPTPGDCWTMGLGAFLVWGLGGPRASNQGETGAEGVVAPCKNWPGPTGPRGPVPPQIPRRAGGFERKTNPFRSSLRIQGKQGLNARTTAFGQLGEMGPPCGVKGGRRKKETGAWLATPNLLAWPRR